MTINLHDLVPYKGLGDLLLGSQRDDNRIMLNSQYRSLPQYGTELLIRDSYYKDGLGLHLDYDDKDLLEFIEVFAPLDPTYEGVHFISEPIGVVVKKLNTIGHFGKFDELGGYDFDELGITLYLPDELIEAVAVYRRGYYNNLKSS